MTLRPSQRRRWRLSAATLVAAVLAIVLPLAAFGSAARRSGTSIFIAGGAESSLITIGTGMTGQSIRDSAGITATAGCSQIAADMVYCGALAPGTTIYAMLGGGNDRFGSIALVARIAYADGGTGNDQLYGDSATNELRGGPGRDIVNGNAGNDILVGGSGRDQLYGGTGNDVISADDGVADAVDCGEGRDAVRADRSDYVFRCERVFRVGT